ncbi:hypothetical protein, partial [Hyphomicrobium methylovorum]|uniref:hypothetical protein n=1 Tax=Hyphomicrobium methylovorum TaxID=84 RepID=UPI001AEE58BE
YTRPEGPDLVGMDSRRRTFAGLLRRMLVLRDDVCTTPWCDALIAHADHSDPARNGAPTSFVNGRGTCARCNLVKEAPAWSVSVRDPITRPGALVEDDLAPRPPREVTVTTPSGLRYRSSPPPLLGWGSDVVGRSLPEVIGARTAVRAVGRRPPPRQAPSGRPKRPLRTSRLERALCRYLR